MARSYTCENNDTSIAYIKIVVDSSTEIIVNYGETISGTYNSSISFTAMPETNFARWKLTTDGGTNYTSFENPFIFVLEENLKIIYAIGNGNSIGIVSTQKWSWETSNGSATAQETISAKYALDYNSKLQMFSYKVWNDMVDKAKAILDATGDYWVNTYATYEQTKLAQGEELTATKFNSLRFNIGSHYSTGITDKYTGNEVLAEYLLTLANSLNGWIDKVQGV